MLTAFRRACSCLGGDVDTESRHPRPQGTVSRRAHSTQAHPPGAQGGQEAPQAAALKGPCPQLQTQMMRPARQAGAWGESCAADVSRWRKERLGCRAGWRGAGPLPWVGLFPPCPLLRAGLGKALASVGDGLVCTGMTFSLTQCWAVLRQSHSLCVRPPPALGEAKSSGPAPLPGTQGWAGHGPAS